MTILECSSGNAGIACAAAAVKDYACIIVMPEMMSAERKLMIHAYGAELVTIPGGESDVDVALKRMKEMAASAPERYWVPGEFENLDNVDTHYTTSGPEVWEQLEGNVDAVIAAVGTGGWLTRVGRFLKEKKPRPQDIRGRAHGVASDQRRALLRARHRRHRRRVDTQYSGPLAARRDHHEFDRGGAPDGAARFARGGSVLRNFLGLQPGRCA